MGGNFKQNVVEYSLDSLATLRSYFKIMIDLVPNSLSANMFCDHCSHEAHTTLHEAHMTNIVASGKMLINREMVYPKK